MYSVTSYGKMIADPRMGPYVKALRRAVTSDSVVLDLGSGPGIFGLLACQMGARHVYAIEPDDVVQLAREAAIANGFANRMTCLQDISLHVQLPERVNLIISDLRGVLPWFRDHLPSISDARDRLLTEDGILIPQRDTLWAALIGAPADYDALVSPWRDNPYHLDLTQANRLVTNAWLKIRAEENQLLVEPICWHKLKYNHVTSTDVKNTINWTAGRSDTSHGLVVWFDSELFDGIGFSNRPGAPNLIYGQAFFPFPRPVELDAGDVIKVTLRADLVGDDYVWQWDTKVVSKNSQLKADFRQSTFFGALLSTERLRKQSSSYVPRLNTEGQIEHGILSMMDGKTPLEEIARQLSLRYPNRFQNQTEALRTASETSLKYSE